MELKPMELTVEDERRFLVKSMPLDIILNNDRSIIEQWYICLDPPIRVRAVKIDDNINYYLTIKIEKEPGKDYELEVVISKSNISILAGARKYNAIAKTRYHIGNFDLDVFYNQLGGLVLIEFEKKSENDVPKISLDFSVVEVTGDERFRSHNLIKLDSVPEEWKREIV